MLSSYLVRPPSSPDSLNRQSTQTEKKVSERAVLIAEIPAVIAGGGGWSQKEWASFNPILRLQYKLCCHRCVAVGSTVVTVGYEGVTEITGDSVDSYTRGEGNSMIFKVPLPQNNVFPSGYLTSSRRPRWEGWLTLATAPEAKFVVP